MSEMQQAMSEYKHPTSEVREHPKPNKLSRLKSRLPPFRSKKGIALVALVALLIIGGGLAGLAALPRRGSGGGNDDSPIRDDAHFYGQSPSVQPSPEMEGLGTWDDALERAKRMVGRMTLDEKVSLTGGIDSDNGCAGNIPAIERLNFTGMCLHDAGQGLRNTDFVNAYPSGIHVGASWNKDLALRRAREMGKEAKMKGVNVLLGPSIGPMGRVVRGGRNWESFSVDPYLTGVLVRETTLGIQGAGVITSTKHFIANEQETYRMQRLPREAVSSNIDDKTMHEFYLWPFQDAVHAGSGNIMCSYQRVNNSYGCQNSKALNGLLKDELGFQGWVVSDWDAQHAGVATALGGMDVAMPKPREFWGDHLIDAVRNESVPEERVTDMAVRIIASWYKMGQDGRDGFPQPGIGMPKDMRTPHPIVDARNASSNRVLLEGAIEGHVLVKNANHSLPLDKPRLLSMFGYSAKSPEEMNPNGGGFGDALTFGAHPISREELEAGFRMDPNFLDWSPIGANGTMIAGGGSGAPSPSRLIAPLDALKMKADDDGTALLWDFDRAEPNVHPSSDTCLVFGNAWASESYDRPTLHDDYTDGLILHVAAHCNNTIVILHNAGPRLVDVWIDHPNVTALIFAHLPGQDSGKALTSILYGQANPSGKLPYTVARNESDYGGLADPDVVSGRRYENFPQSDFDEGVYVDYRHFDAEGIEPRFAFGFGLSYTSFEMSNLTIEVVASGESSGNSSSFSRRSEATNLDSPTVSARAFTSGPRREGGPRDLWDVLVRVTAQVKNIGETTGAEVAQLYVGIPDGPARQLRGFEKPFLEPGDSARVDFELTRRDLSTWDVVSQKWRLQNGTYSVGVGSSVVDLPLEGEFNVVN